MEVNKFEVDYSKVDPKVGPMFRRDWNTEEGGDKSKLANDFVPPARSILRTPAILEYILETTVYPREHKALKGLREATDKHAWKFLATTGDEGQFLEFLVKTLNAKNTIELGVFTGYSLLCTALALPEDGKVIAVDMNRSAYNIGLPYIEEAGVAHKIDFREGACLDTLNTLLSQEEHRGFFDFAFVDADKPNYINYHKILMKLVRVGGIIAYDNTLWGGSVAVADDDDDNVDSLFEMYRYNKPLIQEFNKALVADSRIEITQLSISDGITLCRRIV